jgi:hypothetical protein
MTKLVGIGILLIAAALLAACTASVTPAVQPTAPSTAATLPAATPTQAQTAASPSLEPAGQTPSPLGTAAPTGIGGNLKKGSVVIDSQAVSYDAAKNQALLNLSGGLPTPCHKLQTDVAQPTADGRIDVSIYSLVNPNTICTQVIKPFEAAVPLGALPAGKYTVYANNAKVGEVMIP